MKYELEGADPLHSCATSIANTSHVVVLFSSVSCNPIRLSRHGKKNTRKPSRDVKTRVDEEFRWKLIDLLLVTHPVIQTSRRCHHRL